jgi:hypothetical protein
VPHGIALPLTIDKTSKRLQAQVQSGVKTLKFQKRKEDFLCAE